MRFVIRNLVDVDDVSPAMAPEILWLRVLIFPSTALEVCKLMETILMARARVGVFPKEEGMMRHSGEVFPSIKKPRLSNQKENHPTPNK
jgi:hypothetical protein